MQADQRDIFRQYYRTDIVFKDRYLEEPENAVDVIIPTYNTNPLWRTNLYSIYREIPVRRLLIGDGGCTDDTVEIASEFPRVEIIDQHNRSSLGYCIRELIELVTTEWFVYLHADVYLPSKWFDTMVRYQSRFDWFECDRRKTVLLDYLDVWQNAAERPYSGSQMGRKKAFEPFLSQIEDDYLYRNEDLVLREMVESNGGSYGRVSEIFHYHQLVNKHGMLEPDFVRVKLTRAQDSEWRIRTFDMQARGIIKYTQPNKRYLIGYVERSLGILRQHSALNSKEFCAWTASVNPDWLPYVKGMRGKFGAIRSEVICIVRSLRKILQILVPTVF